MNELEVEQIQPETHPAKKILIKYKTLILSIAGGLSMGTLSGLMNLHNGMDAVIYAGVNQMIHSGISTATLMKVHSILAERVKTLPGEIVPIIVPAALTTAICYMIHKFGIPYLRDPSSEPELSTAPTAVIIAFLMPTYHIAYRRLGRK